MRSDTHTHTLTRRDFVRLGLGTAATIAGVSALPRNAQAFDPGTVTVHENVGGVDYTYPSKYRIVSNYGTADHPLYCTNPDKLVPMPGTVLVKQDISSYVRTNGGGEPWGHDLIRQIVWYIWLAPGFQQGLAAGLWPATDWTGAPMSEHSYFVASHIIVSDIITSNGDVATAGATTEFRQWIWSNLLGYPAGSDTAYVIGSSDNTFERKVEAHLAATGGSEVPSSTSAFDVFLLNGNHMAVSVGGGIDSQSLLGWDYHPQGYLRLKKSGQSGW